MKTLEFRDFIVIRSFKCNIEKLSRRQNKSEMSFSNVAVVEKFAGNFHVCERL